jgi:hypothetical protein
MTQTVAHVRLIATNATMLYVQLCCMNQVAERDGVQHEHILYVDDGETRGKGCDVSVQG